MKSILFSLLFSGISFAQGAGYSCPSSCKAPECTCASRNPPVSNPPQFLVVTFDDGVNANNMAAAQALFSKRRNPNGCPAGATWYVADEITFILLHLDILMLYFEITFVADVLFFYIIAS